MYKENVRVKTETGITNDLYLDAYNHINKVNIQYFDRKMSNTICNELETDIQKMASIVGNGYLSALTQIAVLIGGVIGLFLINRVMLGVVLLCVPIKYIVTKILADAEEKCTTEYIERESDFISWLGSHIDGTRDIRVYNINREKEIEEQTEKLWAIYRKSNLIAQLNMVLDENIYEVLFALVIILGAKFILRVELTLGGLFAFIAYMSYVTAPVSQIMNLRYIFAEILPSIKRLMAFFEQPEEPYAGEKIELDDDIVFENITFAYDKNITPVFQHFNMIIPKGKTILISGKNGVGKSTCMDLLLRFRIVNDGMILVGNRSINDFDIQRYRDNFAVVNQDVYLFDASIRENLCLGNSISNQTLCQILTECDLREFATETGLKYQVGVNGSCLSGGQKKKLALARALLSKRPILIFDEITANLDKNAMKVFINILKQNKRTNNKTIVIISHEELLKNYVDDIVHI